MGEGTTNPFASNIPRFFIYVALRGMSFGLIVATWVIYLQQQHGVSLTEVTLIDVAFWVASALGEVPTGVVADTLGRRTSMIAGASVMAVSILAWAFAPTVPLIMLAYACLAIGATFVSGADEAFFYESVRISGRAAEYARLVGRISATGLAFGAMGNILSGLLATLDLRLPFIAACACYLGQLAIILTFKEPRHEESAGGAARKSYTQILKQALASMRALPPLRYAMLYLVLAPMAAVITETVFVQPHAVALGVPVAGVGFIVMVIHLFNIAGSTWAHRTKGTAGEGRLLYSAPVFVVASLILLAVLRVVPALMFIAVIGFVTAATRPLVLNRIQDAVPDDIRATILSLQSVMFTVAIAVVEPILGYIADQAGLPTSYVVLAVGLAVTMALLLWRSRRYFPAVATA